MVSPLPAQHEDIAQQMVCLRRTDANGRIEPIPAAVIQQIQAACTGLLRRHAARKPVPLMIA